MKARIPPVKNPKPFRKMTDDELMTALNGVTALVDAWCKTNGIISGSVTRSYDLYTAVQNAVRREWVRAKGENAVEPVGALPPARTPRADPQRPRPRRG